MTAAASGRVGGAITPHRRHKQEATSAHKTYRWIIVLQTPPYGTDEQLGLERITSNTDRFAPLSSPCLFISYTNNTKHSHNFSPRVCSRSCTHLRVGVSGLLVVPEALVELVVRLPPVPHRHVHLRMGVCAHRGTQERTTNIRFTPKRRERFCGIACVSPAAAVKEVLVHPGRKREISQANRKQHGAWCSTLPKPCKRDTILPLAAT